MLMNSGQTITSLNQQSESCTQNNEGKLYLLACAVGCGEEGGGGESEHGGWRRGKGVHLPLLLGLLKSSHTLY